MNIRLGRPARKLSESSGSLLLGVVQQFRLSSSIEQVCDEFMKIAKAANVTYASEAGPQLNEWIETILTRPK